MVDVKLTQVFPIEVHFQKLYVIDLFSLRDGKFFELYGPQFVSCDAYIRDFTDIALEVLNRNGGINFLLLLYLGDTVFDPGLPVICKSGGIGVSNMWTALLKKDRHFSGLNSENVDIPMESKIPHGVWRGSVTYRAHHQHVRDSDRFKLVDKYISSNIVDARFSKKDPQLVGDHLYAVSMSRAEQLKYKYLISVEGGDVSSGLKWMLNTNSVVLMRPPTVELVLEESKLEPYVHYIPLSDDFSDVEDKIAWCEQHQEECTDITRRAKLFMKENTVEVLFEKSVRRILDYCNTYNFVITPAYAAQTLPLSLHCANVLIRS